MRTYGQFCPVAQAMEILGERWTILVVRELLAGSDRFSELRRGLPRISRSVLSTRLEQLEDAGILERYEADGRPRYHLTAAGRELRPVLEACGVWAIHHLDRQPRPEHLDAEVLMWDLRRNVVVEAVPAERTLVEFSFPDAKKGRTRFWLHFDRGEADLCVVKPGHDVDLHVETSLEVMTMIHMGDLDPRSAIREGRLRLTGPREQLRAFPRWLGQNHFAAVPRAS